MILFSASKLPVARHSFAGVAILSIGAVLVLACASVQTGGAKQLGFTTPEQAVTAMVAAVGSQDTDQLLAIFGPNGKALVSSGDEIQDMSDREGFIQRYREKNLLEKNGAETAVLLVGAHDWPFPIPMVKKGDSWYFDTQAGIEEMLDRRIGQNELKVIETMMAYSEAQREYAAKDRNGDGVLEYARKIRSEEGKRDGLYWRAQEGQEESPFGPLVAVAAEEGYVDLGKAGPSPTPYHGYLYKTLKGQGSHAPGGAYSYVVNGRMLFGFALLGYPADYGSSGIMTFMVNQNGIVYQKDLGENTKKEVRGLTIYDPDPSWTQVDSK